MLTVGTCFKNVAYAKTAITPALLEARLSWSVYKADGTCLLLQWRNEECTFRVRVAHSKKLGRGGHQSI